MRLKSSKFSRIMKQSCMGVPNIPVDIIINILSRLAFETLVICRSVCKSWYNIMKDPHFVYLHAPPGDFIYLALYKYQTFEEGFKFHLLKLVTSVGEPHKVWKTSDNKTNMKSKVHDPMWFVGSSKGLVCLCEHRKNLLIMNPLFLDDILTVPMPPLALLTEQCHHNTDGSFSSYGFGFDESSKSFKIICISNCLPFGTDHLYHSSAPLVLDLGMGNSSIPSSKFRWRALSSPSLKHPCTYFRPHPVFIDGAILFLGRQAPRGSDLAILSFDMGKEIFKTITLPMSAPQSLRHLDLFDFDGRAGLIWFGKDKSIRIWSLISDDEDNDMNKWVKVFKFKAPYQQFSSLTTEGFDKTRCEIIFCIDINHYFTYNTQTGITSPLPWNRPGFDSLLLHQGSLVCASNLTPLECSS